VIDAGPLGEKQAVVLATSTSARRAQPLKLAPSGVGTAGTT
jgi:hypothetical protein